MDGDTNKQSELLTTKVTGNHQTAHPAAATVSQPSSGAGKFQISSDYTRKVTRTTDIAGRLPNAVYTLPPRLVQAIVGLAEVTDATREALVAECKKFYLASREYEESKEVTIGYYSTYGTQTTTVTLDCGRLFSEGDNRDGECGIGSEEDEVTGPRLIRLPPVLQVWCGDVRWFAKTTRGLYGWGCNDDGRLGVGYDDVYRVRQPHRVPIDGDVLDVSLLPGTSFFRTDSGWFGCGDNLYGQLGLGHTDEVTAPTLIPGSEGVTRWRGGYFCTFGFSEDGHALACGENDDGQCGVGPTDDEVTTLTPVALSIPVDDVMIVDDVTIIRSGTTLFGCGCNLNRQISSNETPQFTTPTPLDLPGPVVKAVIFPVTVFVQLTDGAWVGRGIYLEETFIPVPEADLIDGPDDDPLLPGWTPVNDEVSGKLNALEPDFNVMILPEPNA